MERLETEHDNFRAALRWALVQGEAEMRLRLAGALGEFWTVRGYLAEGRGWLEAPTNSKAAASAWTSKALLWAGHLAREQGDYEQAEALGAESLRLARELGDGADVAAVLYDLGLLALYRNSFDQSRARLEEALALQRESGDAAGVAQTLQALGAGAIAQKDHARASGLHEEALALASETGDAMAISFALGSGALAAASRGDHEEARRLCTEGFGLIVRIGHERFIAHYLHICAVLAVAEGRLARAARLWGAAQALLEAIGAVLSPVETHFFGPYIRAVREGLDETTRETAWAEGREMTRDEATGYALSEEEPPEDEPAARRPAAPLSPREREVARLMAEGLTNRRIAEALGITKRTADTHVTGVLGKLGFDSRERVAAWAREHLPEGDRS